MGRFLRHSPTIVLVLTWIVAAVLLFAVNTSP